MSGNTDNPRIWTGADIYVDLTGAAAAPTTIDDELDPLFKALGIISQDGGISFTDGVTEKKHFGHGNILIRTSYTEAVSSFAVEALEDTDLVFKLSKPGSTSSTAGDVTKRIHRPLNPALSIVPCVIQLVDGTVNARKYLPKVQFSKSGDQKVTDNDIAGFPLTGTILTSTIEDELGNGIEWINLAGAAVESA